jgi:hypothetical protein
MAYFVDNHDNGYKYTQKKTPVKQGPTLRRKMTLNQGMLAERVFQL